MLGLRSLASTAWRGGSRALAQGRRPPGTLFDLARAPWPRLLSTEEEEEVRQSKPKHSKGGRKSRARARIKNAAKGQAKSGAEDDGEVAAGGGSREKRRRDKKGPTSGLWNMISALEEATSSANSKGEGTAVSEAVTASEVEEVGGGAGSESDAENALVPTHHGAALRQLVVVPLRSQPLLPGILLPVVVNDPKTLQAIMEMKERGQAYVGTFFYDMKDEEGEGLAEQESLTDASLQEKGYELSENLEELHQIGSLAQVSRIAVGLIPSSVHRPPFRASLPFTAGIPTCD